MALYRIITEDKNTNDVAKIVSRYFDGFTMIPSCEGYYKGSLEGSLIIEIDTPANHNTPDRVRAICREINLLNGQQCCLLQTFSPLSEFI